MNGRRKAHRDDGPGHAPTLSRRIAAPADAVWEVFADGWSYAGWVVGTSRVRAVDRAWPAAGSRIGHSFGPWPLIIQDYTRVERCDPAEDLVLTARAWPVGEARVHLHVDPDGAESCVVSITEDASSGPGTLLPRPLRRLILVPRNRETLNRLALIAEGRHREPTKR